MVRQGLWEVSSDIGTRLFSGLRHGLTRIHPRALASQGVSETSVEWFKKYLSDRSVCYRLAWTQLQASLPIGEYPRAPRAASLAQYPSCYLLTYGTFRGDLKILTPSANSMQMTSLS